MKELILTFNLLCGADTVSTHIVLHQGGHEFVLPSQNPWVIDGMVAGQAVLGSYALTRLDRNGHPKLARVIGWTLVGIRAVAVVHNVGQIR